MAQVLAPSSPRDSPPYFSSTPPLGYNPPQRPSLLTDAAAFSRTLEYEASKRRTQTTDWNHASSNSFASDSSSLSSSPRFSKTSRESSPPSSVSLEKGDEAEELYFPTYNDVKFQHQQDDSNHPPSPANGAPLDTTPLSQTESTPTNESIVSSPGVSHVADDTAIHDEPSRQVDYLSHEWREEDIWCSWRHIVSKRKIYGERSRLENASWRTWTKAKYHLKTVSPERLNWLKDCDVTWLYGPLQEASLQNHTSESSRKVSKNNSFINKKPILKKRSVSEVMLQKSLSTSSLIKEAAASVQAQRNMMQGGSQAQTPISRTPSDYFCSGRYGLCEAGPSTTNLPSALSSGLQSPENGRRHIRFDDKVEQCIAIDFQDGSHTTDESSSVPQETDEAISSSEDELPMMQTRSKKTSSASSSRRSSIGQDGNGIAMLPSTRLKNHGVETEPADCVASFSRGSHHLGRLQPSSSQETLKPKDPSTNFLIDDDVDADMSWEPSIAFAKDGSSRKPSQDSGSGGEEGFSSGLRRTPSGMFMPFDEDEEETGFASTGVLGRVVDTVNTARDIMHVIMNVGWRS